jgi:hypothetical protein
MTRSTGTSGVWLHALALTALLASAARAEEQAYSTAVQTRPPRPVNALEVTVGLGSAQGYSNLGSGSDLGVGADLGVGWRIDPHWMVGAYGSSALYPAKSDGPSSLGAAAGVQANYHFDTSIQPWIGLGTGWRGYWLGEKSGRTAYQGLDLARLQVGFDVPINRSLTLAPVLSAALTTFLSKPAAAPGATQVNDLSLFVFFGALARFDLFGGTVSGVELASR